MQVKLFRLMMLLTFVFAILGLSGCGAQPTGTNTNLVNVNSNSANLSTANINAANTNSAMGTSVVETKEPDQYQAKVTLQLEAIGGQQTAALPTLSANVARNMVDRRMEFTMPAGGRVVYLDKAGTNYLILPDKRQYAELNRDSLGFDVRRMLMPEQIVQQVKNVPGVKLVGEDNYKGRPVLKYSYGAVANTGSPAGQVATESFLYVDKETSLPLHSETVSQSKSGGNVQGYNSLRVITEITDIKTDAPADLFQAPTDFEKIESSQVRAQVDMIFNALGTLLAQMLQQGQAQNNAATPLATVTATP